MTSTATISTNASSTTVSIVSMSVCVILTVLDDDDSVDEDDNDDDDDIFDSLAASRDAVKVPCTMMLLFMPSLSFLPSTFVAMLSCILS